MSQHPSRESDTQERHPVAPPAGRDDNRATAVERLLWTPTEGQDLTKSYFPLSENSDDSSD